MIKVMIRQAAKRRGFDNAYQFGQSIGVKRMVASRIWNNEQPPKLKTLDRICNAWGCGLDELVEHRPDKKPSSNGHTSAASTNGLKVAAKTSGKSRQTKRSR